VTVGQQQLAEGDVIRVNNEIEMVREAGG
jgi:hypothetical protein